MKKMDFPGLPAEKKPKLADLSKLEVGKVEYSNQNQVIVEAKSVTENSDELLLNSSWSLPTSLSSTVSSKFLDTVPKPELNLQSESQTTLPFISPPTGSDFCIASLSARGDCSKAKMKAENVINNTNSSVHQNGISSYTYDNCDNGLKDCSQPNTCINDQNTSQSYVQTYKVKDLVLKAKDKMLVNSQLKTFLEENSSSHNTFIKENKPDLTTLIKRNEENSGRLKSDHQHIDSSLIPQIFTSLKPIQNSIEHTMDTADEKCCDTINCEVDIKGNLSDDKTKQGENNCADDHVVDSGDGDGNNSTQVSEYLKIEKEKSDVLTGIDRINNSPVLHPNTGRELRKSRRRGALEVVQCPVCKAQIKNSQFNAHLELEVARMEKWRKDYSKKNKKRLSNTSNSSASVRQPATTGENDEEQQMNHEQRSQAFLEVKHNREKRKKRTNRPHGEGTECPVCNKRIMGNQQEVNRHVNICLVKEDADVDIEGSDCNKSDLDTSDQDNSDTGEFEEYEWAGQTRIRATSMIGGSFVESGFTVGRHCTDDEVGELNIDGDETDVYGQSQYNEADLIPCTADEPQEEKARLAIRNVLLQNEGGSCSSSQSHDSTKWSTSEDQTQELIDTGQQGGRLSRSKQIEVLESKIKSLQKELDAEKSDKYKCLICMESYDCPVTSIQCWHVYCEECWLRTLGAKKLCPQCNMITHPSDLRKIYL